MSCSCCRDIAREYQGLDVCQGARLRQYAQDLAILHSHIYGRGVIRHRDDLVYVHEKHAIRRLDAHTMATDLVIDTSDIGTHPAALAVDSQGRIYGTSPVLFLNNLVRYNAAGTFDAAWFNGPIASQRAADYTRLLVRSDDSLVFSGNPNVAEAIDITIVDEDGELLAAVGVPDLLDEPFLVDIAIGAGDSILATWRSGPSLEYTLHAISYDDGLVEQWRQELDTTDQPWPNPWNANRGLITADPTGRAYSALEDRLSQVTAGGDIAWQITLPGEPICTQAVAEGVWVVWLDPEPVESVQPLRLGLVDASGDITRERSIPDIVTVGKYCCDLGADDTLWLIGGVTPFVLGRTLTDEWPYIPGNEP